MKQIEQKKRESISLSKSRKIKLYWLMQLMGWFSLMFIEVFNYTFFINGEFKWIYLSAFGIFPIIGIFTTHVYKTFFIPSLTFSHGLTKVWSKAFLDIVLISLIMVIIARISSIAGVSSILNMELGQIIASIGPQFLNIARYVMVWIIIYYLYHILIRNNEILEEKLVAQLNAQTTELELLKIQLNPSFLFQSLSSIKSLVLQDKEKARDSIIKLSELLRYSLNYEKNTLVNLREELAELQKYLDLEKTRLGNQFTYSIELEEGLLEKKVPTASILNLMENAIRYGIETLEQGGKVDLKGEVHSAQVQFELKYEIDLKKATRANEAVEKLKLRLEKIYGKKASLTFKVGPAHLMNSILTLPNQP